MSLEKIYIASKTRHAARWRDLRATGIDIISTWIDEAGEGESCDVGDLARRCIVEASTCNRLILYHEEGDVMKGALIEAGAALANSIPVFVVGKPVSESSAFRQHYLWIECPTLGDALPFKKNERRAL